MSSLPSRIAYADDDDTMRTLVRKAVENYQKGILFITCADGQDLVNQAKAIKPELILLDLVMPGLNGPDTIARLQATPGAAKTPIIFMTGKTKVEMNETYKAMNVIGVLHKPFDVETLPKQIEELWGAYQKG